MKRTNCDTEVDKERRQNEYRVDDRPRECSGSDDAILSPEDTLSIRHKSIVLDYNSQEEQAVMEEAPAWGKLLYRELKSQSSQYAQFKMQFNAFKAVVNRRLTEYEKSAEFISFKYEDIELECDFLQRNIDAVHMKNDDLKIEMKDIGTRLDDLEQYSRRNCLILNGAEEKHDEIVDDVVLKVLNTKMEAGISIQDIQRAHRLGKRLSENSFSERDKKSRPIIIKFASYRKRQEVFRHKKKLKGSGLVIAENLTKKRQLLFNRVKEIVGLRNCWTNDGRIMASLNETLFTVTREEDLQRLFSEVNRGRSRNHSFSSER